MRAFWFLVIVACWCTWSGCAAGLGNAQKPPSLADAGGYQYPADKGYRLHLCEQGEPASSEVREIDGNLVVFGRCGTQGEHEPLLRLECPPLFQPSLEVAYQGPSYEVLQQTCGWINYGDYAAPALRNYAEAYRIAMEWEELSTIRKFAIASYLDQLGVRLPSTMGILRRIAYIYRYDEEDFQYFFEREEAVALRTKNLYAMSLQFLEDQTQ